MGMLGKSWKVGGDADWTTSDDDVRLARPLPRRATPGDRPSFEHESEDEYLAAIESTNEMWDSAPATWKDRPHVMVVEEPPHFDKLKMKP
jgi:hypothetical protein